MVRSGKDALIQVSQADTDTDSLSRKIQWSLVSELY